MSTVQNRSIPRNQNAARHQGGQHHIGLFGAPGFTGRPIRRFRSLADDQARTLGGLTFRQRAARLPEVVAPVITASTAPRPTVTMDELMAKHRRLRPGQVAQDEPAPEAAPATPFMLACAAASDAREAFLHHHDDEEADFARRCAGAGYVEATLAGEGC